MKQSYASIQIRHEGKGQVPLDQVLATIRENTAHLLGILGAARLPLVVQTYSGNTLILRIPKRALPDLRVVFCFIRRLSGSGQACHFMIEKVGPRAPKEGAQSKGLKSISR